MISRRWRCLAKSGQAQHYLRHLRTDTVPALRALPGFLGLSILSRELPGGVEFLVITQWQSLADIARFAGSDTEAAVVPTVAADMMIEYDRRARHYQLIG